MLAVGFAGLAVRVSNAFHYRIDLGYDAVGNWQYIRQLMGSWALPAPDSGWSTAHPPLFYYGAAALARVFESLGPRFTQVAIPIASSLVGLASIAVVVVVVRRCGREDPARAFLAAALLLFLPAHIYMSAMLSEEILSASLITLTIAGVVLQLTGQIPANRQLGWAALVGLTGGLALLTKLSGALVIGTALVAYAIHGARTKKLSNALASAATVALVASAVGGWYYARNLAVHGYLYPQGLEVHGVIQEMPPGERGVADYLRIPLATWTDPQLLNESLLHSVWGGTYVTIWFDGHRHFLPRLQPRVSVVGSIILILAIVPTLAFGLGIGRGIRQVLGGDAHSLGTHLPQLLLVLVTLAGYVHFTWKNPYFPCVKGSYLLGLAMPFAFYASDVLAHWTRDSGLRSKLIWLNLAALAAVVLATFTFGLVFEKLEGPGLPWAHLAQAGAVQ
jgi:4-amino-4-deoxy-L-arabinose transferase-like glycosyltransferase